jgi:hypothetical protein
LPISAGKTNIRFHAMYFAATSSWEEEKKMKKERSGAYRSIDMVLLSAVLAVLASVQLSAQSSDFAGLQRHINKQVTVETQEGQVTGQLLRVEENRLVVYEAGRPKPIDRQSVKKVTTHKSRHTAAWVGGMTAAGLGAGFLIGFRAFDHATYAERKIGTTALVGAGAGAAGGYALSRIGKRDEVIYQSE